MIRRPPRSPLFPSTTLSRSPPRLEALLHRAVAHALGLARQLAFLLGEPATKLELTGERSEEHTSELQSRLHLVCRLLLEKKKRATSMTRRPINTDRSGPRPA